MTPEKLLDLFFTLADTATSPATTQELRDFAESKFIPYINTTDFAIKKATSLINKAVKHAEAYIKTLTRERQNLTKRIRII